MKNSKEIAENIYKKADVYLAARTKKRKIAISVASVALCAALIITAVQLITRHSSVPVVSPDDNTYSSTSQSSTTKSTASSTAALTARPTSTKAHSDTVNLSYFSATPKFPELVNIFDYNQRQKLSEDNPVDSKFSDSISDFSYLTAAQLLKDSEKNQNYSPISLYYALSLLTSGCSGNNKSELTNLLGVADTDYLSTQCSNLFRRMYWDSNFGRLKINNSLWLNKDQKFNQSYIDNATKNFYASLFNVDFNNKKDTETRIKNWIKQNTKGISDPIINVDNKTLMCIFNTIDYVAKWDVGDVDEEQRSFAVSEKNKLNCDFIKKDSNTTLYTGENFTRASITMMDYTKITFVLPNEGTNVESLMSSEKALKTAFESGIASQSGRFDFHIPKFNFNSDYNLIKMLNNLGVKSIFNPSTGFSGITSQNAFISSVVQQTNIKLDKDGVAASAVTGITMVPNGVPKIVSEMVLDRPFLYQISARDGTPLFIGVVQNPTAK